MSSSDALQYYVAGVCGQWDAFPVSGVGPIFGNKRPGDVDFQRDVVEPRHAAGETFSSDEVADMSDTQYRSLIDHAAMMQKDLPEQRMLEVGKVHKGLYGWSAEHIGDLSHRMGASHVNQVGSPAGNYDVADARRDKLEPAIRDFNRPYGYEREHREQVRSNSRSTSVTVAEYDQKLDAAGEAYSQAHEALPSYNAPMKVARDTAVHLGRQQFDEVRAGLSKMEYMTANQTRYNTFMGQSGAVRWMRSQGR